MVGGDLFLLNQSIHSFIPIRRMRLWFLMMKRKEIITWIRVYHIWWMNADSKKWWEVKFFLWNESVNSFIPVSRMNLWRPIIKRKEIILWIYDYPNWKTNINSKFGRKRGFSFKTKVSVSFILKRRMCLWCTIMKRKKINTRIHIYPNW